MPVGQAGEIWLKGPAITPGYIGRDPALDFSDGWFRTGDVARMDADGCYFLVDRVKDMYKSGGENVAPAEVEQLLAEHPGVAEVAVIGVAHEKWGEVGLAVVAPNGGPVACPLRRAASAVQASISAGAGRTATSQRDWQGGQGRAARALRRHGHCVRM